MRQTNLVSQYLSKSIQSYLLEKLSPQGEKETLIQAEECLRFLYLSSLTQGSIPVTKTIDDIWHFLILQTKEYSELCQSLPGKKMIHHSSDIYLKHFSLESPSLLENEEAEMESQRQLEWLVSYVFNFGDFTEDNIPYWSFAAALCEKYKLSSDQLNNELRAFLVN